MKKCIWMMVCVLMGVAVQAELVAHWKFDEGSGSSIADSSGNQPAGTVQGTAVWGSEASGGGLRIDSTSAASYVKFAGLNIGGGNAMSIAFWAKDDAVADYSATQIMFWGLDSGGGTKLKCYFPYTPSADDCRQWMLFYHPANTSYNSAVYSSSEAEREARVNEWHHWVFQKDAGQNLTQVYLDGELVATGDGIYGVASLAELRFGGNSDPTNEYDGYVKDLRVYDTLLSGTEIDSIAVPEPTSICLFGVSAFLLVSLRRMSQA